MRCSERWKHSRAKTAGPEHIECIADLCRRVLTGGLWRMTHSPICFTTLVYYGCLIFWKKEKEEIEWKREREREGAKEKYITIRGSWNHVVEILHCWFLELRQFMKLYEVIKGFWSGKPLDLDYVLERALWQPKKEINLKTERLEIWRFDVSRTSHTVVSYLLFLIFWLQFPVLNQQTVLNIDTQKIFWITFFFNVL